MLSRLTIVLFAASLVAACTIEFIDNDGDDDDQSSLDGGGLPDASSDAWWVPDLDGGEAPDSTSGWPDAGSWPDATPDAPAIVCGNGLLDNGEQCDNGQPGVNTATCDRDCTLAACGDALVNFPAGEQCDTGGASPSCDVDCTAVVCGDGLVNAVAGEQCDDGNAVDTDACRNNCTLP
jgi:cysteine-rich repeat protein